MTYSCAHTFQQYGLLVRDDAMQSGRWVPIVYRSLLPSSLRKQWYWSTTLHGITYKILQL